MKSTKRFLGTLVFLIANIIIVWSPGTPTHAAPKATITVTSTGDGAPVPANCPGASCRLRDAIAAASPGDTINFNLTLPAVITLTNDLLTINNLTIAGPGANNLAISGNNASTVFATNGQVTLSGVTIRNGNAGLNYGGGIFNSGTLTLTNATVMTNTTTTLAGGIFNSGGTLSIYTSTIQNNYAGMDGGAGIYNNTSSAVALISNSVISGNVTTGGGGGIVSGGLLTITTSTLSNNQAGSNGGALYNTGKLTLSNSTLSGNRAVDTNAGGGAIFTTSTLTMTLNNVTISGNSANPLGTGWGGGILSINTPSNLNNVTLFGNSAGSNGGGGIRTSGTNPFTLENTIIGGNTAGYGANCTGGLPLTSLDYNLIQGDCGLAGVTTHNITGTSPKLATLGNYGGPTQTHALMIDSPAINAGNSATCLATDQRGIARPVDGTCDIGAYEGSLSFLSLFFPFITK